jgi:tetratricopeptide (TPR) repeat protein/DNA-binding winged helix-turn-helix (wHTH) protein
MPLHRGFRLGNCEVRPVEGLVITADGKAALHPHAMEVLLYLAAHPGELLSRDQIIKAVWGRHSVRQDTLTRNITEIRHALGDDAHDPEFIQTIPREGYRLLARVTPLSPPAPELNMVYAPGLPRQWWEEVKRRRVFKVMAAYGFAVWALLQVADIIVPLVFDNPTAVMATLMALGTAGAPVALLMAWVLQITEDGIKVDASPDSKTMRRIKILPWLMALVIAVLVGALTYLFVRAPFVDGRVRIAVMPLVSIGIEENEVFCDGLTQDLNFVLGRIPELKVAPQTAVDLFRNASLQDAEVARRLNVTYLMEGSCRYDGQQFRVIAQLVEADSGITSWSQAYSVPTANIFQVQEDIARQVARSLRLVLSSGTEQKLDYVPTNSSDAYTAYLEARGVLRRTPGEESLANAEALFKQAVAIDPGYSQAYAGLCETYLAWYELERAAGRFEEAESACELALVKSRGGVEVHQAMGKLYSYAGRYSEALKSFSRVVELDPTLADGYVGTAIVLAEMDKLDQSEAEFKKAIAQDPVYWVSVNSYGAFLMKRGRFAEAAEQFLKVTLLDPTSTLAFNNLGAASVMAGNFKQAAEAFEYSNAIAPDAAALYNSGTMYFYAGDLERAQQLYRDAIELTPEDYRIWGGLGDALHGLGAGEAATAAYMRAIELSLSALDVNPVDQLTRAAMAHYLARTGRLEEAADAIDIASLASPGHMDIRYYEALVRMDQGKVDQALVAIAAALEAGYPPGLLAADPGFEDLRSDPRFKGLLDRP